MTAFRGLMVATLTPFDPSDRLDLGIIRGHTDFLIESGVSGLCPAGTTGEMLYLSVGEKVRLIEETCFSAARRVPVVAGVWALHEREIALLCRAAEAAGASAVFLPPPIYYPASDESTYHWYAGAKESSGLAVFAYNIPSYAANSVSLDCAERLVNDGIIAGIKDSTGKKDQMSELVQRFGTRIAIEAASDGFVSEARELGAHGFISALANVFPKAVARLWEGEDALQRPLTELRTAVKNAGGIPALKHLAGLRGFTFGESRLPGTRLSSEAQRALEQVFHGAADAGIE